MVTSLPMHRELTLALRPVLPVFEADLHAAMATTSFLQGHQCISVSTTNFRPRNTHVPNKGRSLFVKDEADNDLYLNMFRTPQAGSGTVVEKRKRSARAHPYVVVALTSGPALARRAPCPPSHASQALVFSVDLFLAGFASVARCDEVLADCLDDAPAILCHAESLHPLFSSHAAKAVMMVLKNRSLSVHALL